MYLALWLATLVSNFGSFGQVVAAAWLMTSMAPSPHIVALVQTAAALPVVLLALPSGAIADMYDRRKVMLFAQSLMLAASAGLLILTAFHLIAPWSLLALIFMIGSGTALNAPAWQASVGAQVPHEELPNAIALNSLGFNLARSLGPALGGLLLEAAGAAAAFALNVCTYGGLIIVLGLWRPKTQQRAAPGSLLVAIAQGWRHVRASPILLGVLVQVATFGLSASAIWALLPLVARQSFSGGPGAYGLLLSGLGVGAVIGALGSTPLRRRMSRNGLIRAAQCAYAAGAVALALSPLLAIAFAALVMIGAAWVVTLSSLNIVVQTTAPGWVLGRAISLFHMAAFSGLAAGSWLWGLAASHWSISAALIASAAAMAVPIFLPVLEPPGSAS